MKYILLCLLLFLQRETLAQSYSCISQEPKTYFTNSRGYLKGMRIDSVRSEGGNTVYYPFKTARGRYEDYFTIADTLGGSWWGENIIQTPMGQTLTPNRWGDTIWINNHALLNEPWIFYRDTTPLYYEAAVVTWDTITFLGALDSVKTIRLTAKIGTAVISTDPLNNLEIMLSKDRGWLHAINFYLFPYHTPGMPIQDWNFDCYFAEANDRKPATNTTALVFKRIDFVPAYSDEVFNYQPGDAFWRYEGTDYMDGSWSTRYLKTVITGKTHTDTTMEYAIDAWTISRRYNPPSQAVLDSSSGSLTVKKHVLLTDTLRMPEEWHNRNYYYYLPEDTSYCYRSAFYGIFTDRISRNGRYGGGGPEPAFPFNSFKNHLGRLSWATGGSIINNIQQNGSLVSAWKGTDFCDPGNSVVSIEENARPPELKIQLFPNPASSRLEIKWDNGKSRSGCKVELYHVSGIMALRKENVSGQCDFDISALSDGLYFVRLYNSEGSATRKLVIRH